jgi:hypothetical protein
MSVNPFLAPNADEAPRQAVAGVPLVWRLVGLCEVLLGFLLAVPGVVFVLLEAIDTSPSDPDFSGLAYFAGGLLVLAGVGVGLPGFLLRRGYLWSQAVLFAEVVVVALGVILVELRR